MGAMGFSSNATMPALPSTILGVGTDLAIPLLLLACMATVAIVVQCCCSSKRRRRAKSRTRAHRGGRAHKHVRLPTEDVDDDVESGP